MKAGRLKAPVHRRGHFQVVDNATRASPPAGTVEVWYS